MPSCNVMSTYGKCTLVDYNTTSIECLCDICTSNSNRMRKLSTSKAFKATQVSAVTLYVLNDYITTTSQADVNW